MDWLRLGDPSFGLGAASIASDLRRAGASVWAILDAVNRRRFAPDSLFVEVTEAVSRAGPDVLAGVSAFVWCEQEVRELLPVLGPGPMWS